MKIKRDSDVRYEFERSLTSLQRPMVVLARRLVDDEWDADDVLQSALANAWSRYPSSLPVSNFRAWIARFVVLEAMNRARLRARQRGREHSLRHEPVDELGSRDVARRLELEMIYEDRRRNPTTLLESIDRHLSRALLVLTENERTALLLRAIVELNCREIADVLQVPRGTVMARLFRAREKIRLALGHRDPPPPLHTREEGHREVP